MPILEDPIWQIDTYQVGKTFSPNHWEFVSSHLPGKPAVVFEQAESEFVAEWQKWVSSEMRERAENRIQLCLKIESLTKANEALTAQQALDLAEKLLPILSDLEEELELANQVVNQPAFVDCPTDIRNNLAFAYEALNRLYRTLVSLTEDLAMIPEYHRRMQTLEGDKGRAVLWKKAKA